MSNDVINSTTWRIGRVLAPRPTTTFDDSTNFSSANFSFISVSTVVSLRSPPTARANTFVPLFYHPSPFHPPLGIFSRRFFLYIIYYFATIYSIVTNWSRLTRKKKKNSNSNNEPVHNRIYRVLQLICHRNIIYVPLIVPATSDRTHQFNIIIYARSQCTRYNDTILYTNNAKLYTRTSYIETV